MRSIPDRHDVVIVGARAAGAATALLLARRGHDVLVLDRDSFPSDTVSTHQIARPGVVQLARWGLLDAVLDSGAPALRTVTFHHPGETVVRPVKDSAGVDLLVAPRRHILDAILADAAERAGARISFGVTVTDVLHDATGRAVGVRGATSSGAAVQVAARFVVGADGLASRVARAVGAPIGEQRGDAGAVQYAYYDNLTWPGIELFAADRAVAGVFPTHHGQACVWVGTPSVVARSARRRAVSRAGAFTGLLGAAAPELEARLRAGRRVSDVRGMLRMPNQARRAHGPGWALVGDAGYHRDAVTGAGISDAYRDAELLAVALHQSLTGRSAETVALTRYQDQRDRALREVFELTTALAAYPAADRIVALQKQLGRALDAAANHLAGTLPGARVLAAA